MGQIARVLVRAPGCGLERQGVGKSARVWARAPGCGPERQGVGQSARVWARAPGCWPECQGTGIATNYLSLTGQEALYMHACDSVLCSDHRL